MSFSFLRNFALFLTVSTAHFGGAQALAADLELPPPPPPAPAEAAAPAPALRGEVLISGGGYGVDNGFDDRAFVALQGSLYDETGLGVHADVSYVDREENAAFVAAGLSFVPVKGTRLKLMAGTSSQNDEIHPELYLNGTAIFDFGPQVGVAASSELIYRSYRSGVDELQLKGALSKYFSPFSNGHYVIGSVHGSVNYVTPGDNVGWEAGGSLLYVMPSTATAGIGVFGGTSAYDNLVGPVALSVRNDYVGVRPSVSFNMSSQTELFVRGEYLMTDFYDLAGGYAGVKYAF